MSILISSAINKDQYTFTYCGTDDHEKRMKIIDKLNSTAHSFKVLQCYYLKNERSKNFCPESNFILVKWANFKEEEHVIFKDDTHLSFLIKALRMELGSAEVIYSDS